MYGLSSGVIGVHVSVGFAIIIYKFIIMAEIFYKYIEFFLTEEDIRGMIEPESSSYTNWLQLLQDNVDNCQPVVDRSKNNYFIKCTQEYTDIIRLTNSLNTIPEPTQLIINEYVLSMNSLFLKLNYYKELYLYAHHHFDLLRESIKDKIIFGGSKSKSNPKSNPSPLEKFKEKIRNKIKLITT